MRCENKSKIFLSAINSPQGEFLSLRHNEFGGLPIILVNVVNISEQRMHVKYKVIQIRDGTDLI